MKDEEIRGFVERLAAAEKVAFDHGLIGVEVICECGAYALLQLQAERDALRQEAAALRDALEEATGWDWLTDPEEIPGSVVAEINAALSQEDK